MVCDALARLALVVVATPDIQAATQANERTRVRDTVQSLATRVDVLIDDLGAQERVHGFSSRIGAVVGRLERGLEHLDDYLTGRSPGNLLPGLHEFEAAESDYRSSAREYYPGIGCVGGGSS